MFIDYVFDVCRSLARHGFDRIVLVNGHGWNDPLLRAVTHRVCKEAPALCAPVTYWRMVDDVARGLRESRCPGHGS
ncbi:TPA: creatininase family protein, partial [Candidatus Bathyarchaeota archaeon]|nr:creatininase family protein [Candidatus Bathyarchaeota archaeon]